MPTVSIIVPIYNAQKSLRRCVDSILKQEYKDFEVWLMDDGSKDESGAICDSYAAMDPRVHVIHKENSGVSDTRNQALSLATGEFIQFLDADDFITPEATRYLVNAAQEHEVDMVIADFYRVVGENLSHKGSIDDQGVLSREEFADQMAKGPADFYYGVLWNKLFRRSIIEEFAIRMDENLNWCEDFIFNMEYILHVKNVYVLRTPIYYYVKTEGSLVSQGMSISATVRMKLNVVEYYTQFYKNIYPDTSYASKRPTIYSFLLDFASDGTALGILPGTKKLGKERNIFIHPAKLNMPWVYQYYEQLLLDRNLNNVAIQYDLELKEVKILLFIHSFGGIVELKELASYIGSSQMALIASIEVLALKGFLSLDQRNHPSKALLGEQASDIIKKIDDAVEDLEAACLEDFTPEEQERYLSYRKRSLANLESRLER
ncbi:MAG: glycosyltransferase [Lachnospiraceae bacterium]|nr:glycosyltransferase [Lachnospiraceae bacterium]